MFGIQFGIAMAIMTVFSFVVKPAIYPIYSAAFDAIFL